MKKSLLFFLILIVFTCIYCSKPEEPEIAPCTGQDVIPSGHKEYVPYMIGDSIYFKNNNGGKATSYVIDHRLDVGEYNFDRGSYACVESIHCTIELNLNDSTFQMFDFDEDGASKGYAVFIRGEPLFYAIPYLGDVIQHDTLIFNGNIYYDVLVAKCSEGYECMRFDSLGFARNEGLVFYKLDGEHWVLE